MCYEFSEWSWKLRAAGVGAQAREAEKAARRKASPRPNRPRPRRRQGARYRSGVIAAQHQTTKETKAPRLRGFLFLHLPCEVQAPGSQSKNGAHKRTP